MLIAQISDTHIPANSPDAAASDPRAGELRRCVADINRQGVDVVIHTGDSTHNGTADEYAIVREILSELKAPYFLIPGNRDRRETLREAFSHLSYMPKNGEFLHYAVEDFPIRLIALDSHDPGQRKGAFCERRQAWLEETLAREPGKPTVLFIHHPPFDIAEQNYIGGYRHPQDAENLAALVSRHPQVERLLCGHVHCEHRESWAGTVATSMPSLAVDLRKEKDAAMETATLYVLHTASDDGDLVSRTQIVTG